MEEYDRYGTVLRASVGPAPYKVRHVPPLVGVDSADGPGDAAEERGIALRVEVMTCDPRAVKERDRDRAAPRLFGDRDPRLLQHGRRELASQERGESLAGMRDGRPRRDGLARDRAFQHLKARVRGPIAVIQADRLVRELLGDVDIGARGNDESRTDDHRPAPDLKRAYRTFRHPAVIAALSPLEHRGFAAFLKPALIRDRARQGPFRRGPDVTRFARHHPEVQSLRGEQALVHGDQHVETAEGGHRLDR